MPELPEVETIARGLDKRVAGDIIESVWLGEKPEPLKSSPEEIAAVLERARIAKVHRVGKHIVFDLERRTRGSKGPPVRHGQWVVHLGMTGRMQVCSPKDQLLKHTHAVLKLKSGRELRFVDPRRFGRLAVVSFNENAGEGFAAPGDEPLESEIDRFVALFRKRRTPIKSALLNQKLLSGVGNIYADESLFRAGIRPRRRAASLTRERLRRLHCALKEVLNEAIALGGSSVSDYVDAEGREGFFQLQHRVYGREGEPCLVCQTSIKRVIIAGRSSHYCPHCQR
jgi:formamidopyrimidine-DNA glycosylase